jgi:hypothetical protein
MELPKEITKQVHELIDKPPSGKANQQIHRLLLHDHADIPKLFELIINKHRSDLLIFLLTNNRFPSVPFLTISLSSLLRNVLQYKLVDIAQIYILTLSHIIDDKYLI